MGVDGDDGILGVLWRKKFYNTRGIAGDHGEHLLFFRV